MHWNFIRLYSRKQFRENGNRQELMNYVGVKSQIINELDNILGWKHGSKNHKQNALRKKWFLTRSHLPIDFERIITWGNEVISYFSKKIKNLMLNFQYKSRLCKTNMSMQFRLLIHLIWILVAVSCKSGRTELESNQWVFRMQRFRWNKYGIQPNCYTTRGTCWRFITCLSWNTFAGSYQQYSG